MSLSPWRGLGLALFLTLALAACSLFKSSQTAAPDEAEEAAIQEKITVYTALESDEAATYLADFGLAYPEIQVNLVHQSVSVLIKQLLAERENPQADVIWGMPVTSVLFFEWNDLLKPYAPANLERIEARFRDTRQPPDWVGDYVVISAFCVNPYEAKRRGAPLPRRWQDLRNPVYRRALIMPSPTSSGAGSMVVLDLLQLYGEQEGWRYLDDLHKNIVKYTDSTTDPCQLVEKGEYPIGISKTSIGLSKAENLYPSEGSAWELIASALVRKDPIQPAARTFLDWAISDSAMRLYAHQSALTAAKTGLASPAGFPADPNTQMLDKDIPWAAANRERIVAEWLRRYSDKVPAE